MNVTFIPKSARAKARGEVLAQKARSAMSTGAKSAGKIKSNTVLTPLTAMKIHLFRNARLDAKPSMQIYADKLAQHLRQLSPWSIQEISIRGTKLPLLKDSLSKDFFYPVYARFRQGDINHIIDHSYGSLAYALDPDRTVVTCHDLIPLELDSQSSWLGKKKFLYNIRGMLRAKSIIADSESTKQSIKKHFSYKGKIHVIYPGVDECFKKINDPHEIRRIKAKFKIEKKYEYLLHVGVSIPSKNIEMILNVLPALPQCRLIKIGSFGRSQLELIQKLNIENQISIFSNLELNNLVGIYNVVDALVFPSFFEGFGLPVAEALACGCPVICSNTSSLPEVAGDVAHYIDPHSENSLEAAIEEVLTDETLRNKLIQKGFTQAQKFNWQKTASEVLNLYKQIPQS